MGTSIAITVSMGAPIKRGVNIKFIITIAIVIVTAPTANATAAPFLVFVF